jgi:hypothetical protein
VASGIPKSLIINYNSILATFFCIFFGGLEFVGHSFAFLCRPFCIFGEMSGLEV